jgi:pimeloyl-ACP methyl ester carboxylesterase
VQRIRLRRDAARVTNPSSGASLAVRVVSGESDQPRAGLILIPGGLSPGSDYFGVTKISERFARAGYATVEFDPDGRGDSGGSEDCNGPAQQDGLAAIINYAAGLAIVDPARIVVASFCYGLALAVGMLARHPALPVRLLVDWEGPAWRDEIKKLAPFRERRIEDPRGADAWWREREPAELLPGVAVPYQRVQSNPDHAQASVEHALELLRLATMPKHGGEGKSPWTRLNGNPPNRVFSADDRVSYLPAVAAEIVVLPYLLELVPPEGRPHLP